MFRAAECLIRLLYKKVDVVIEKKLKNYDRTDIKNW